MKKNHEKEKKKRILAMTYKQRVFMAKVLEGLKKNSEIRTLAKACEKLGIHQANGRRALLEHSKGKVAQENKAAILEMAGIKNKPAKAKTTTKPRFVHSNVPMYSAIENKAIRCWVFKNP